MHTPVHSQEETFQLLQYGEITSPQLSPWGSNYTFLVDIRDGARECKAVYKPRNGEIPLWDFPSGTLYKREYAAYLLSQILGWDFIPHTVIREGPHGVGSLQIFLDHDPRVNYFALRESDGDALRAIACFDLVSNNADRKASHCIKGPDGKVWGIDHGLTFNAVLKVRTVIWDFGGTPIPDYFLDGTSAFLESFKNPTERVLELLGLLDQEEVAALAQRIARLLEAREFPVLDRRRLR